MPIFSQTINPFCGQRQLNTFSPSAKCDGVCQKCVCVLCTLELIPVASHRFEVHDETTIRSATRNDDDPVGSLIYQPDRRRRASQTGSSSHREPGIGGWQLELVQAYTIHTHFRHTPSHSTLREIVFSCLCPQKGFIVWLKMGMFTQKFSTINRFVSLL